MQISMNRSFSLLATATILAGCATAPTSEDPSDQELSAEESAPEQEADQPVETGQSGQYVVNFRDRSIDLEPYVQGFPYSGFAPDLEHRFMLYFETTPEGKWLRHLTWEDDEAVLDVTAGEVLNDIDWSTRSYWGGEYNGVLERFVFRGDEINDEIINLYALNLEDGSVEAITDVDYIYGVGFSEDERLMAYVVRHGKVDPFESCLHIRNLSTDEDRELWCDDAGADRLTWTAVEFFDDDGSVIVRMQHDGNRRTTNLARFSLDEPGPPQLLLERGVEHLRLATIADSLDEEGLLYISAKSGMDNLYRYDFESEESAVLTDLEHDISSATMIERESGLPLLLLLQRLPYGTIVELRNPEDGQVLWTDTRSESIRVGDEFEGDVVFSMSAVDTPFRMERVTAIPPYFQEGGMEPVVGDEGDRLAQETSLMAALPEELAEQLIHCDVERVEFPTFDDVDGKPRMLHAYLFRPRNSPRDDQRLARMTAFYGGGNHFSTANQIMCEAGIITFSPSPRGSRGFGAEFAALTNGDLGGDEIVDLFHGARWLEANLNLRSYQIGVYGSSHGGYATMRAMTFPPSTNDHDDWYDFGFGMSHAGFSDIVHFYHNSNIPDWVLLEAGHPVDEFEKLQDRSPLTHVERLRAPLLLTHGSNDRRVPVEGSRQFAAAAEELNRPVVYEEFEGQGHGIDGLDNRVRYYRAIFQFLEDRVEQRLIDGAGR